MLTGGEGRQSRSQRDLIREPATVRQRLSEMLARSRKRTKKRRALGAVVGASHGLAAAGLVQLTGLDPIGTLLIVIAVTLAATAAHRALRARRNRRARASSAFGR